jgi:[ribosomal protein S18]-alanine N-acetyltransferase
LVVGTEHEALNNMTIREYKVQDKEQCIKLFESNCPKFFDKSEHDLFIKWLDHQTNNEFEYKSPTYTNSEKDVYLVIELPDEGIVACGGFYITREQQEARLAWGMVHADFHKHGLGTVLYNCRKEFIKKEWPNHTITLGTSQHTYPFYERMGMKVVASIKHGYGPDLDRYDLEERI